MASVDTESFNGVLEWVVWRVAGVYALASLSESHRNPKERRPGSAFQQITESILLYFDQQISISSHPINKVSKKGGPFINSLKIK